jgi:hypothetical protein
MESASMAMARANFDYLLREDMRYDYLSIENRKKLIDLIESNLTEYDKGRKNKAKVTHREMNYKRKFTNDFLQLIANIINEHSNAGKGENDYIWIYANITSIFNIIAFRDQYEGITRYAPLNNLYFLFLCNLYCNFNYYLNKRYYGISGTGIRGSDFIHQFLFMFEQSGVTGMFYISEEQYAELFENKDGKYDCNPIEGTIEKTTVDGKPMYQLSNSALIQGAKNYIESNSHMTIVSSVAASSIASSRKRKYKTPYDRPTSHKGGRATSHKGGRASKRHKKHKRTKTHKKRK